MTSRLLRRGARPALLMLAAAAAGPAAHASNLLVILMDDVGVDMIGRYGEAGACSRSAGQCRVYLDCPPGEDCLFDDAYTPTIDSLADEGLLFRNAWASPTCSPTRANILTGRHGFRTGVLGVGDDLPAGESTLAELLAPAYATAAIGKWHLGGGADGPNDQGFDHFAGALGGGVGDYLDWTRIVDGTSTSCFPGSTACPVNAYATTVNVDDALAWIGARTGPWFLYLSFNAPHAPFHVPPHELVSPGTLARLPQLSGEPAPAGTSCSGSQRTICYQAMLEVLDAELGRLLQGVPDPTTVILMGDNGTPAGVVRPPFISTRSKGSIYEGGVNVPLIIRPAGGAAAPHETAALVHAVDVFATVLDLAGISPPGDRAVDGVSLAPLLADPAAAVRTMDYAQAAAGSAVRDERFKLIRLSSHDELYDLEGAGSGGAPDPFEINDLLLGNCSQSAAQSCHGDGDCPGAEVCDLPALGSRQQAARQRLALDHDLLRASCDPFLCSGPITCATDVGELTVVPGAGGGATLSWAAPAGGTAYDVVGGDLAVLRQSGGDFATATTACLANDLATLSLADGSGLAAGEVRWYLVRAGASPCNGTYGMDTASPDRRDALIGASPLACP